MCWDPSPGEGSESEPSLQQEFPLLTELGMFRWLEEQNRIYFPFMEEGGPIVGLLLTGFVMGKAQQAVSSCPAVHLSQLQGHPRFLTATPLYPCLPRSQGCAHGCQDQSVKQHSHSSDLDPGAPGHHPGTAQGVPSEQMPNNSQIPAQH